MKSLDQGSRIVEVLAKYGGKRLTEARIARVADDLMQALGLRKRLRREARQCVVAVSDGKGSVSVRKVKPRPFGSFPGEVGDKGVVISTPSAD